MNCGVPCPYDHAGTACTKPAFHAGPCAWPTAIDMESWLPLCRLCGKKAARCPCPAFDARGNSNVAPPPAPPRPAWAARQIALNAALARLCQQRRDERYDAGLDRKRRRAPLPAVAVILDPATRPRRAARPWCPAHAWAQVESCSMCVHARAAHAADERTET